DQGLDGVAPVDGQVELRPDELKVMGQPHGGGEGLVVGATNRGSAWARPSRRVCSWVWTEKSRIHATSWVRECSAMLADWRPWASTSCRAACRHRVRVKCARRVLRRTRMLLPEPSSQ